MCPDASPQMNLVEGEAGKLHRLTGPPRVVIEWVFFKFQIKQFRHIDEHIPTTKLMYYLGRNVIQQKTITIMAGTKLWSYYGVVS